MGGKSTDTTGSTGYTGGLTPYAQNLFGGNPAPATDSGSTGMQKLGQQIMQASNNFSAQQGGPEEQAIAGIGNALVNKFAPKQPITSPTGTPNLFGGTPPTFQMHSPITSPMLNPSGSTGFQMQHPITSPLYTGPTGFQMQPPITSPMFTPGAAGTPITSPMATGGNLFGR
jgi:hypothetical protein